MFVWLSEEPPLCVFIVPQRNYRLILKSFFAACIFFCSLYLFLQLVSFLSTSLVLFCSFRMG